MLAAFRASLSGCCLGARHAADHSDKLSCFPIAQQPLLFFAMNTEQLAHASNSQPELTSSHHSH